MNRKQQEKIEELTLLLIEKDKEIKRQGELLNDLQRRLERLERSARDMKF